MTAAVAAQSASHSYSNDVTGFCSAHNETDRIKQAAIDLQEMLTNCIGENIDRQLRAEMCHTAQAHWTEIGSAKQCSCHYGFYSTAQVAANLLHLVVQLVTFPKPICIEDRAAQTEAAEHCSRTVQCEAPSCASIATQTDIVDNSSTKQRGDQEVQVNTIVTFARQKTKESVQELVSMCEQEVQTEIGTSAQQTQTEIKEMRESIAQVCCETSDADVQVTLLCQRCRRRSSKNHFCVDCTVPPRREVKDADTQAEEQCHCCFECPGKTSLCGVCLKVLNVSPPSEVDLCWECGVRIAFVKGGRCTSCVKTNMNEPPQPNFPVRIGGGYDVLRVSHLEGAEAYSEAAVETVRPDHNQFAHGAPGSRTLPDRFHVGVVFQPATSRQHSVEPDKSEMVPKTPRQRPKSAGDAIRRGTSTQHKRPQSAGAVSSNASGTVYRRRPQSAVDTRILSEKAERLISQPRPCMWRVLGDNRQARDPPPW